MKERADERLIRGYLAAYAADIKIETVDIIDSTNDEMKGVREKAKKKSLFSLPKSRQGAEAQRAEAFFLPMEQGYT